MALSLSLSQNPLNTNSDFESSCDHHGSSSSPPPPPNTDQSMKILIVNVGHGCDIMESIRDVAHRNQASVVVLSASGTVASATLQNTVHGAPTFRFYGPFNLLSLTGSYVFDPQYTLLPGATHHHPSSFSFGIQLCTYSRVIVGRTDGTVIAGDDVVLTISIFENPKINKCVPQGEDKDEKDNGDDNNHDPYNSRDMSAFNSVSSGIEG